MKFVLPVFLLLLMSSFTLAETAYVSDNLRVGVRPEPENVAPVGVVTSGMKLEILDRDGAYIEIQSENGQQGWIKDIYVVSEPPAIIQLKQLKLSEKKLRSQLNTLEENNSVLQTTNIGLTEKISNLEAHQKSYQMEQAKQQAEKFTDNSADRYSWIWWVLTIILLAGAGFFSGINWYRQHIMKRLGGLRV